MAKQDKEQPAAEQVEGQQELPFDAAPEDRDFDADGPADPDAQQAATEATEATSRPLGAQDGRP